MYAIIETGGKQVKVEEGQAIFIEKLNVEAGETVTVLIDDGQGARQASQEISRLQRLRTAGRDVGCIRLISTLTVLERAAGGKHLPDKAGMRDIYRRLRELDDGLPPIDNTRLMAPALWSQSAAGVILPAG